MQQYEYKLTLNGGIFVLPPLEVMTDLSIYSATYVALQSTCYPLK